MTSYALTIVVCTFNGATRLEKVLGCLAHQSLYSSHKCLLLLVDNNSSDSSAAFARKIWSSYEEPCDLQIILETQQGLVHARKAAILNSKSEFILLMTIITSTIIILRLRLK